LQKKNVDQIPGNLRKTPVEKEIHIAAHSIVLFSSPAPRAKAEQAGISKEEGSL
jgi:hypothetical protein